MSLSYRADIDGLRAIAVLSVLLYHVEAPLVSGGYVGVDVFFVISGFLITSIIVKDIDAGAYSIARFYERRIRRIFPALFPVILFSLVVGALMYDWRAFKDLGQSITATTLFSSNILFWTERGYFDTPAYTKPLLHTWSLAVEEQFYIVFPLLLMAIDRFLHRRYVPWLLAGLMVSFAASVYWMHHDADGVFYLVPFRAWELLVGAIIALKVIPEDFLSRAMREVLSAVGMGLILYSVFVYDETTAFPGVAAIAPVAGAGFVIMGGMNGGGASGAVTRLLSWRPLVFVGLISYSLYLWHWPLVAFSKFLLFRDHYVWYEQLVLIGLSLGLAFVSYHWIERPWRGSQGVVSSRRILFAGSLGVMFMFSATGVAMHLRNGVFPWNEVCANNPRLGRLASKSTMSPVLIGDKTKEASVVLWGDSHAGSLAPALDAACKRQGAAGYVFSAGSTLPILSIERLSGNFDETAFNESVLSFIQERRIRTVLLVGAWTHYITGKGELLIDGQVVAPSERRVVVILEELEKTVEHLERNGIRVYVVEDVPAWNMDPTRFVCLEMRYPGIKGFSRWRELVTYRSDEQYRAEINAACERLRFIRQPLAHMKDSSPDETVLRNGILMYNDSNHLSQAGSVSVSSMFDDVLARETHQGVNACLP